MLESPEDLLDEQAAEIARLQELLRGIDANRYWEGRWRDEKAENERLLAALNAIGQRATELQQLDICRLVLSALEQKAEGRDEGLPTAEDVRGIIPLEQKAGEK